MTETKANLSQLALCLMVLGFIVGMATVVRSCERDKQNFELNRMKIEKNNFGPVK